MPPDDRASSTDALIGSVVGGRYRVDDRLGRGGMGIVYRALHQDLGRPVAIKVLAAEVVSKHNAVERFLREARTAASLGHPNIVDVYDLGRLDDGRPYLAMELLDGETLGDRLERGWTANPVEAAHWVQQAASALDAVHARGIVHRDIKPDNLLLATRDDGQVVLKLLDFGLAGLLTPTAELRRLTKTGVVYGTPEYMAPEAASDMHPDHRSDVYSLTVVAYELITGRLPINAPSSFEILRRKLDHDAPRLGDGDGRVFAESLERVIARGLTRFVDERYDTAGELAAELVAAAEEDMQARMSALESAPTMRDLPNVAEQGPPPALVVSAPHPAPPERSTSQITAPREALSPGPAVDAGVGGVPSPASDRRSRSRSAPLPLVRLRPSEAKAEVPQTPARTPRAPRAPSEEIVLPVSKSWLMPAAMVVLLALAGIVGAWLALR